jgi:hypothetical protein
MVGGDEDHESCGSGFFDNATKVMINDFGAADFGILVGSVPDHIPIGKVGYDEIVFLLNAFQNLFCHLRQAELGDLVERDAFRGGDAHVVLAGEGLVIATIEEKGDVGKFFLLGCMELSQTGSADDFGEGLLDL